MNSTARQRGLVSHVVFNVGNWSTTDTTARRQPCQFTNLRQGHFLGEGGGFDMNVQGIGRISVPDQQLTIEAFDSSQHDTQGLISIFENYIYGESTGYLGQPRMVSLPNSNENAFKDERTTTQNLFTSYLRTSGYIARAKEGPRSQSGTHVAIVHFLDSQGEIRNERGTTRINRGDIYINTARNYHITFGSGVYRRILFSKSLMNRMLDTPNDIVILRRNDAITSVVLSTMESSVDALKCGDSNRTQLAARISASVSQCVLLKANSKSQSHGYDHIRDRAMEYIRDNLNCDDLSVTNVASHVNVSRATLYRAFENIGGLKDFIMSERIATAKSMLRAGRLDRGFVTSVAYDAGFSSPEHFSKVFKAKTGMTPTQFVRVGLN